MSSHRTLRDMVNDRHGSIHRFCRHHPELVRSTVYQVLGGRYAGNVARQEGVIRAALEGTPLPESPRVVPEAEALLGVIMDVKCGRCRRTDRRGCRGCRLQAQREAEAVRVFLTQGR